MRIFTRYVLIEVGQVFLVSLISLTSLMMLVGMAKEALQQGLGVQHVIRLIPYMLPVALMYSMPGTVLFAVTNVYGRMAGANEIVALKSLGLNPMVFLWPTLILSAVLSFTAVWLNDLGVTWGHYGVGQVVVDSLEDVAYGMLRKQGSFSSSALSVNVRGVEGRTLLRPTFTFRSGGDSPPVTITCQEAELRSKPGSGVLVIVCHDGTVEAGGTSLEFPDTIEREIQLDGGGHGAPAAAHTALAALPDAIVKQQHEIEVREQRLAADMGYRMLTGDFPSLGSPDWANRERDLNEQKSQLYRLQTEVPRRWANGFSCLCFALVGSCLAMHRRTGDALATFFTCFGLILVVYYPLLMYGLDRCKSGTLPPYYVWLGNVTLIAWGLHLRRKVMRY